MSVSKLCALAIRFLAPALMLGLAALSFVPGQTISRLDAKQGAAVTTATETIQNFSVSANTSAGVSFLPQTGPTVPLDANDNFPMAVTPPETIAVSVQAGGS